MHDSAPDDKPDTREESTRHILPAALLIFLSLQLFAAVRAPVPGVNEPHYLSKARHYWDPSWCPGDHFLDSSNTHLVFYQTVGLLTRWLPLESVAWVGRALAHLLLAFAWSNLVSRLMPGRWSSLWVVWVFLALAACGNFSGEWIVGGVEAKVFAYAWVFWSIAAFLGGRWNRAALYAGLAISFHPLVGVWSLLSAGFAGAIAMIQRRRGRTTVDAKPLSVGQALLPTVLLVLTALPGLIPAFAVVAGGSAQDSFAANYIQVFFRLRHHLDPMEFPAAAYAGYSLLIGFWLIGRRWTRPHRSEAWWTTFVLGSVLIALVGLCVGWNAQPPQQIPAGEKVYYAVRLLLMKFYPFRLADALVPLAAAVVFVGLVRRGCGADGPSLEGVSRQPSRWLLPLLCSALFGFALLRPAMDSNPSKMDKQRLADWHDVCRWIAVETPTNAHFLTPTRESWAFKWYAQRAEYVVFKDSPQDAAGLVEWNRRLHSLNRWAKENYSGQSYSIEALGQLQRETGITHIVTRRLGPFEIEPIYRNGSYRVYRLENVDDAYHH